MKTQTIRVYTRMQDNQDGGYTFYGYSSQEELIKDHPRYDEMTDELREEILSEDDPYENGYIGTMPLEVSIDENGKVHLIGNICAHVGQ